MVCKTKGCKNTVELSSYPKTQTGWCEPCYQHNYYLTRTKKKRAILRQKYGYKFKPRRFWGVACIHVNCSKPPVISERCQYHYALFNKQNRNARNSKPRRRFFAPKMG